MATEFASSRFGSVQVMRAIAANMVVVSHLADVEAKFSTGYTIIPQCPGLGTAGVHFFFVISGFVMALVAAKQPSAIRFLYDRVTRIYPIYWFYSSILLVAYLAFPSALADRSGVSLVGSFLLWPTSEKPLLIVGWTLIHEMYFYAVIALFLLARIPMFFGLLTWAMVVALPIPATTPFLSLIFSPLTFDFIAGALAGLAIRQFDVSALPRFAFLQHLGDASYSVYLSHVLVMSTMARVFAAMPMHGWIIEAVFLAFCLITVNAWGMISYRYIERPLIKAARSAWGERRDPALSARPTT